MAWAEEKPITITKWRALSHHEQDVWETDYASVQTVSYDADRYDDPLLKDMVAGRIEQGLQQLESYAQERSRREALRRASAGAAIATLKTEHDGLLKELGISLEADTMPQETAPVAPRDDTRMVTASKIDLREIRDGTRIRVRIYPRTFVCPRCGHYQIIDNSAVDLVCPCCKSKAQRDGKEGDSTWMRQEPLIHICPRCAKIEELIPEDVRKPESGPLLCPHCGGHLHYYGKERVSTIRWQCVKCHRYYPERRRPIDRSCSCSIWEKDEEGKSKPSKMHIDRTSGSNTYALAFSLVRVGNQELSLPILYERHRMDKDQGIRTWHLNDLLGTLTGQEGAIFKQMFPIDTAFLVSNIQTSTTVYGYSTRLASKQIREDERLPQFFKNSDGTYRAYVINEQGRALVIVLDKERLARAAQQGVPSSRWRSYDEIIEDEIDQLARSSPFQENLDNPQNFPLVASSHTIEHAVFKQAVAEVGLDDFGSQILLRDATIVLYERRSIGYGGVVQLTAKHGFLKLMNEVKSILTSCPHDCDQGCLACVYITDAWCMPFSRREIGRWYPPNALLLRSRAAMMMKPDQETSEDDI